jgi:hypothetical protein
MNPFKLIDKFLSLSQEQHDAVIKFCIAFTFCCTVVIMVAISLYSVVFVTQPMRGMAPADKQFFLILSDMSKYILGSLATLLAVKGKDALPKFVPEGLSTEKERLAASEPTATDKPKRKEPQLDPVPETFIITGFRGKAAPAPVQHDVRDE